MQRRFIKKEECFTGVSREKAGKRAGRFSKMHLCIGENRPVRFVKFPSAFLRNTQIQDYQRIGSPIFIPMGISGIFPFVPLAGLCKENLIIKEFNFAVRIFLVNFAA